MTAPMTAPIPDCPRCGKLAEKHCVDSRTCDMVRCHACKGYGTRDGKRWTPFHKS